MDLSSYIGHPTVLLALSFCLTRLPLVSVGIKWSDWRQKWAGRVRQAGAEEGSLGVAACGETAANQSQRDLVRLDNHWVVGAGGPVSTTSFLKFSFLAPFLFSALTWPGSLFRHNPFHPT